MSKSFSQSQDPSCEPRQNENQRFHPKVCNSTHSKSEIAKVASGLNTIHSANMQYWTCGAVASSEERAAYQRRLGPGEEIGGALAKPLFGASPHSIEMHTTKNKGEGT
jgi:hypothetical protein